MTKHKWHKEIIAWANGEEIEMLGSDKKWAQLDWPSFDPNYEYRIKPQPKEPQYLYVYEKGGVYNEVMISQYAGFGGYIGKIKLEAIDD